MADANNSEALINNESLKWKKCTMTWDIEGIINMHDDYVIKSPTYVEGGRRWSMTLYPNRHGFSAIFLHAEEKHQLNALKMAKFSILNKERKEIFKKKQAEIPTASSVKTSVGIKEFAHILDMHQVHHSGREYYNQHKYLIQPENTLRISCEIWVEAIAMEEKDCRQGSNLSLDLGQILDSKQFSDFKIKCDGKEFDCVKAILAARSNVFKIMLQSDMKESRTGEVIVEDVKAEVMEQVVKFIYTDKVDDAALVKMADQILAAGHKYELHGLKMICEKYLGKNMNHENVLDLLNLARLYKLEHLKVIVFNFIKSTECDDIKL